MDSLRGIPVEYKLDAFNMPRTGTTLSPQNWLCRSERNPAFDTLVHINGDNAYSPQIPDTKLMVTSKVQFLQLQHVFRQKCKKAQSLTRPTTHAAISTSHNSISSQYSQTFTSLAAPKANPIFHAAKIKTYSQKHISTLAILLLLHHHSTFISHKLSEGANNTKRGTNTT